VLRYVKITDKQGKITSIKYERREIEEALII